MMRARIVLLALVASVLGSGCASIGPSSVNRDRFDYIVSISESWKRQMLQNLLKVRYADAPVFLDIASVINAYTLDSRLAVEGQLAPVGRGETFGNVGGSAAYGDRPTITYTPLSGEKFARSLMTPLPVGALLYLVQSGYPADAVFRIGAVSINGLYNAYGARADTQAGDPRFAELLIAMREAQRTQALGIRSKSAQDRNSVVVYFRDAGETGAGAVAQIRELLDLDPAVREFDVVYGQFPSDRREIAILSRSTLQVLADCASYIDVPTSEVAEGRVYSPPRSADDLSRFPSLLRVYHGEVAPADAHVAVRYRERWFWISDRDVGSKSVLNALLLLFSLTEATSAQVPLVTIPAR